VKLNYLPGNRRLFIIALGEILRFLKVRKKMVDLTALNAGLYKMVRVISSNSKKISDISFVRLHLMSSTIVAI
jgi:hypothetical protein